MDMQIGERRPQMTETSAVPTTTDADVTPDRANGALLGGPAVSVMTAPDGPNGPTVPERTAVLLSILNAQYKVLSTIAKNMGVSEKERQLRERHKAELKKKIDELEHRKDLTEKEIINIANTFIAAEDRALLDARMEENRLKG